MNKFLVMHLGKKISRHTLKIGPQITPKRPPPKCTGTASRGSSIRAFISNLDFFEKGKLFFCESYYFYLFSIIFTNVLHGIRHHPYLRHQIYSISSLLLNAPLICVLQILSSVLWCYSLILHRFCFKFQTVINVKMEHSI